MSAANIWTQGNREHGAEMYIKALEIPLKQVVTIGDMSSDVLMFRNSGVRIATGNASADAPDLPVYIDSPMAVDASHRYCCFGDDHNLDVNLLMDDNVCPLRCRDTHFVRDVADSKVLNAMPGPAVILSASGILTGGRILHHLKWRLPDARNALLLSGIRRKGPGGGRCSRAPRLSASTARRS